MHNCLICVSTAKINKVKFINHQKKLLSLEHNPLSSSFYKTTHDLFGLNGYVLLIQGGHHFTLQSFEQGVWAVKDDEEKSIVTFLYHHQFPQVSSIKV